MRWARKRRASGLRKWRWVDREREREREDRFGFAPKGADVEPTRAFFSRQNIPISRSYWKGENDTCTRREQVSATCWAVDDDKTPSPPMLIQLCLSVSLSAIAWKAPPLSHCNFICPFLFFFLFLIYFFFSLDLKLEWKAVTNGKWWPGYESFSSSNSWQFRSSHNTIFHYSVHAFVIFPIPIIYKNLGNYTQHFLDLD